MKKFGIIELSAILLMTFGITYLDFDNLNFQDNYKAYIQLMIGGILILYILYKRSQANKRE